MAGASETVRRILGAATVSVLLLTLIAGSVGRRPGSVAFDSPAGTSAATAAGMAAGAAADTAPFYVSVGDSYAAGYQPTGPNSGATTRNGFAYQVVQRAGNVRLMNFGCSGVTTTDVLVTRGCAPAALGPGAVPYPSKSQAAAAETFLRANRGQVAAVTVIIGGNDIKPCYATGATTGCLTAAVHRMTTQLGVLLRGLRAAAGPAVPIIGLTYPDVFLALDLEPDVADHRIAERSVAFFRTVLNPALRTVYHAVDAQFVDITRATGAYLPADRLVTLAPYGRIPQAVARICRLTFMCEYGDVHPRTSGYALIADAVIESYQH